MTQQEAEELTESVGSYGAEDFDNASESEVEVEAKPQGNRAESLEEYGSVSWEEDDQQSVGSPDGKEVQRPARPMPRGGASSQESESEAGMPAKASFVGIGGSAGSCSEGDYGGGDSDWEEESAGVPGIPTSPVGGTRAAPKPLQDSQHEDSPLSKSQVFDTVKASDSEVPASHRDLAADHARVFVRGLTLRLQAGCFAESLAALVTSTSTTSLASPAAAVEVVPEQQIARSWLSSIYERIMLTLTEDTRVNDVLRQAGDEEFEGIENVRHPFSPEEGGDSDEQAVSRPSDKDDPRHVSGLHSDDEEDDEAADEVAAIIAAARAAADSSRPDAAGTSSFPQWEERSVAAAVSTAAKDAVEFGPIGSPPPDEEACSGPGWVRDAGVQCGNTAVRASTVASEAPREKAGCFSPARTGGWPVSRAYTPSVQDQDVQTKISGSVPGPPRRNSSDIRLSLSSTCLETVDECEKDEFDTPVSSPHPTQAGQLNSVGPVVQGPIRPPGAPPINRRPLPSGGSAAGAAVSAVGGPYPHQQSSGFPDRMHSSGGLTFGRVLKDRSYMADLADAWNAAPLSAREPRDSQLMQQLAELPPPLPAGHLHRLCDPLVRQGRLYWHQHSQHLKPGSPRSPSPGTDRGSRKPKLSASGLEHRPPEAPSLSMTAWPKDFVRVPSLGPHKGRSVRKMFGTQRPQPATLYAPKTHPGLHSLGCRGVHSGGSRF